MVTFGEGNKPLGPTRVREILNQLNRHYIFRWGGKILIVQLVQQHTTRTQKLLTRVMLITPNLILKELQCYKT
jgi:hypothetical protein